MYRSKIPAMKRGDILGHEFMGEVADAGAQVTHLKKGDRVVVPFVIACGSCFFCDMQLFSGCETTNPDRGAIMNKKSQRAGAALFGFSHLYGGMPGGQAEYVRVPKANVGPIKIPAALADEPVLLLSDIPPTGYQAVLNTGLGKGGSLAIFGAGPVGQMAAASAKMLGIDRIFMVEHHRYRLNFACATYGVVPFNFDDGGAADFILQASDGRGVDGVVDAVGFEAKGSKLETVMTDLELAQAAEGHNTFDKKEDDCRNCHAPGGLNARRKSSSTCAAMSASSAVIVSSRLWLMPPLPQRVNSIATSVMFAIAIASCPAPEARL